jgi:hypothetical protein
MRETRVIKQILIPAIKLWLHTQLSQIAELEIQIQASDRQILSGRIPQVSIYASNAVYQGLHVTQVQLTAENIQINVGAILRGKPLRLLETISVIGQLMIKEQDLNYSLSSNLLSTALNDVLVKVLPEEWAKTKGINWEKIALAQQRIYLQGIEYSEDRPKLLEITTSIELFSGQELQIALIQLLIDHQVTMLENNLVYSIYLGSDVDLQEVHLNSRSLICSGRMNIHP